MVSSKKAQYPPMKALRFLPSDCTQVCSFRTMTFLTSRRTLLSQSAALLGFAFLPQVQAASHAAAFWSAEVFERARPIERAVLDHPFLKALADGTIEKDKILWYLAQNAGYLKNYAASLSRACAKLENPEDRSLVAQWIRDTAGTETWTLDLLKKFSAGRDAAPFMRLRPTTLFYSSWEAKASEEGTAGEAWAALLPCFTMYETAGRFIAENIKAENPYREWLSAYGDPAYSKTVESAVALADRLARRETPEGRARMTENYLTSCRLEWALWDAAEKLEDWPV